MVCKNCGATLNDGEKFCTNCGWKVEETTDPFAVSTVRTGFSQRVESDDFQLALQKKQRILTIVSCVLTALPLVVCLVFGMVSHAPMVQALVAGLAISVVMAIIVLIVNLKNRLEKSFEGTVAKKDIGMRVSGSRGSRLRVRKKYLVWFETGARRKKKKAVTLEVYNYLKEGDKVRYLPGFAFPYEKYDKSADGGKVLCLFCGTLQDQGPAECPACHNPLL